MESEITPNGRGENWATFVEQLAPIERFALIGLLQRNPNLTPEQIRVPDIVGEEKCDSAESWMSSHFRVALRAYCDLRGQVGPFGPDALKVLLPVFCAGAGLATGGIAAALFGLLLSTSTESWCGRYARRSYEGDGTYSAEGDDISGHFWLDEQPAIDELRRDDRYPNPRHRIEFHVPAEIIGRVEVPLVDQKQQIERCCGGEEAVNTFSFHDVYSRKAVSGFVKTGREDSDPRCFSFVASDLQVR